MFTHTGKRHLSIKTRQKSPLPRQHSLGVSVLSDLLSHIPKSSCRQDSPGAAPVCPTEVCGQVELMRHRGLPAAGRGPATVPGWPETPAASLPFLAPPPLTYHTPAAGATARVRGSLLLLLWRHPNPRAVPPSDSPFPSRGAHKPLHSSHQDVRAGEAQANTPALKLHIPWG